MLPVRERLCNKSTMRYSSIKFGQPRTATSGGDSFVQSFQFNRQARLLGPHSHFISSPDNPHQADQQTSDAQRYDEDNDVLEQTEPF